MENIFKGMFSKVDSGVCRLSMDGGIAIKTSNGYKTYDVEKKKLVNCDDFVIDIDSDFFFVLPTNKAKVGDIILVGGKPKCVVEVNNETIKVINYENSVIEDILPERHLFMKDTYIYGKIVSMFGQNFAKDKKFMRYIMMSQLMNSNSSSMAKMLPFIMMNGNLDNVFDGMFDGMLNLESSIDNNETK